MLISEWFATQNLIGLVAEKLSLENFFLLELLVLLGLNQILRPCLKRAQHVFVRIGQAMSPQNCTKPMFRVLVAFAWYMVAAMWIIPIYVTLVQSIFVKRELDTFSYLLNNFSLFFLMVSSCTTMLILVERKIPMLEEWADLKWGKSSQNYLDFCNRSIFALKFGFVFSISFSSLPLIVAALHL